MIKLNSRAKESANTESFRTMFGGIKAKVVGVVLMSTILFSGQLFAEEQTWKVNLKDADVRAFVSQVADITGYSFVIDPRVKGKVTVVSNASMNKASVYEMFLSVLGVHGFAAIPGKDVVKIIRQNDAKQTAQNDRFLKRTPSEQAALCDVVS